VAPIDVDAERAATPGCTVVAHLDNAGSSLPTAATIAATVEHLRLEASIGGYEAAAAVESRLDAVRASAATLLGAGRHEVAITGSDTQSWTKALWGFLLGGGIARHQRVLVDRITYNSHYLGLLQVASLVGCRVDVVASRDDGALDLGALDDELARGDVALVSATHVGTHRGLVNPVEEVGDACRRAGVAWFLDACQSLGQIPLDVSRLGCAVLTATGRKWLRGPRGTGLLYVEAAVAERSRPPGIDGTSAHWVDATRYELAPGARRFEEFEVPYAAQLGLGVALDHVLALGVDAVADAVAAHAQHLCTGLSGIDGVQLTDVGGPRCGIVSFEKAGVPPERIKQAATAAGMNVGISAAPWARLDMDAAGQESVVRASPHYYNTVDELDRLLDIVAGAR